MTHPSTHLENASVDTEASAYHTADYNVIYDVRPGTQCPQCGSGEVYSPLQAMDMPMLLQCLRCGCIRPSSEYHD